MRPENTGEFSRRLVLKTKLLITIRKRELISLPHDFLKNDVPKYSIKLKLKYNASNMDS